MAITFDQLQEATLSFSSKLSKQQLGLIYHQPDPNSVVPNCILNSLSTKRKKGGDVRYGWFFLHRTSKFGDYLIATHHAVWHDHSLNELIDVTTYHTNKKHRPITHNDKLLFLLDDTALPIRHDNMLIPLPSHFFPIHGKVELINYISNLRNGELKFYNEKYGFK